MHLYTRQRSTVAFWTQHYFLSGTHLTKHDYIAKPHTSLHEFNTSASHCSMELEEQFGCANIGKTFESIWTLLKDHLTNFLKLHIFQKSANRVSDETGKLLVCIMATDALSSSFLRKAITTVTSTFWRSTCLLWEKLLWQELPWSILDRGKRTRCTPLDI